jgi:glycerol uptake facilitator-like aquaporin
MGAPLRWAQGTAAEAIGTALLLVVVVGSGIMAERLAEGNDAVALLANALATGAGLYVLITVLGPVSGAHFNPLVSLAEASRGAISWLCCGRYLAAQIFGAYAGVVLAHLMFALPLLQTGTRLRSTPGEAVGEAIATFGLLLIVRGASCSRPQLVPVAVACWITSAYWFTSSTSFANPAVTLARAVTDTFAGIAPTSVPMFLLGQFAGALLALVVSGWLFSLQRQPVSHD